VVRWSARIPPGLFLQETGSRIPSYASLRIGFLLIRGNSFYHFKQRRVLLRGMLDPTFAQVRGGLPQPTRSMH